jgi:hypothetical protein
VIPHAAECNCYAAYFYGSVNEINDEAISLSAAGPRYFTHKLITQMPSVDNKQTPAQAATSTFLLFFHYQASCALNYFWKSTGASRVGLLYIYLSPWLGFSLLVHYSPRDLWLRVLWGLITCSKDSISCFLCCGIFWFEKPCRVRARAFAHVSGARGERCAQ